MHSRINALIILGVFSSLLLVGCGGAAPEEAIVDEKIGSASSAALNTESSPGSSTASSLITIEVADAKPATSFAQSTSSAYTRSSRASSTASVVNASSIALIIASSSKSNYSVVSSAHVSSAPSSTISSTLSSASSYSSSYPHSSTASMLPLLSSSSAPSSQSIQSSSSVKSIASAFSSSSFSSSLIGTSSAGITSVSSSSSKAVGSSSTSSSLFAISSAGISSSSSLGSLASSSATSIMSTGDIQAPTTPQALAKQLATMNSIYLVWAPSTDNVNVVNYNIYRNGIFHSVTSNAKPEFSDTGLSAGVIYEYSVRAKDAAGNQSNASQKLSITTLAIDDGKDHLIWSRPTLRENGDSLTESEIGGYEVRYKEAGNTEYTVAIVNGSNTRVYSAPRGVMVNPEVAVYDTNGLYSKFMPINIK